MSFLDPRSLCRCAQVCWFWKYLSELDQIWMPKCFKFGWILPFVPTPFEQGVWKRHYLECVQGLQYIRPKVRSAWCHEHCTIKKGCLQVLTSFCRALCYLLQYILVTRQKSHKINIFHRFQNMLLPAHVILILQQLLLIKLQQALGWEQFPIGYSLSYQRNTNNE